jgi:L-threonylcarbamoyladenylate synthase
VVEAVRQVVEGDTLVDVSSRHDCSRPAERSAGLAAAALAIARCELVVLPTDTVYGVGCDAFSVPAVRALLAAKLRPDGPPPAVLVGNALALDGLARDVSPAVRELAAAFWPGALTLVCRAQPTLLWGLGERGGGTVAIRMPLHAVALELLERTGPLAVSNAAVAGRPAPLSCPEAATQLGEAVAVYLDGGPSRAATASTVLDCTGDVPVVLRSGALGLDELRGVVPDVLGPVG